MLTLNHDIFVINKNSAVRKAIFGNNWCHNYLTDENSSDIVTYVTSANNDKDNDNNNNND